MSPTLANLVAGLFAFAFAAISIALWLTRSKLKSELNQSEQKRLMLESRLSQTTSSPAEGAQKFTKSSKQNSSQSRATSASTSASGEILDLRREVSHLKDESRKLKEELRSKETALKDSAKNKENELFHLTETNRSLLAQLQERVVRPNPADAEIASQLKVQLSRAESEISSLKHLLQAAQGEKNSAIEEKKKDLTEARLKSRVQELERSLKAFQFAEGENSGKTLDPTAFLRWRDRALEGRKMYQMMKQLRDLSDQKLSHYQKGLEVLCKHWLAQNSQNPHIVGASAESELSPLPASLGHEEGKASEKQNVDALFARSIEICFQLEGGQTGSLPSEKGSTSGKTLNVAANSSLIHLSH